MKNSDVHDQIARVRENSDIPAEDVNEEPLAADIPPDRTRQFASTSFSRMRTGWSGDDAETVMELNALAGELVRNRMQAAFALMERVYRTVRTPETDDGGVVVAYPDGTPVWKKDGLGMPEEDWDQIDGDERRRLLLAISAHMFEWEIESSRLWADAMYSKGIWEEAFAQGFTAIPPGVVSGRPTVDDRTQWGHKNAAQERYFALFRSSMSRQAEGILKAMRGFQRVLENPAIW